MLESLKRRGLVAGGIYPNRFQDRVAVVTGGASGMGRAQALRLAAEGAKVAVVDLDAGRGEAVVDEACRSGGQATFVRADLCHAEEVDVAMATIKRRYGAPDLLFNNAGTVLVKAFTETTEDEFDRLMGVNVRSAFMVMRRVVAEMVANGGGSIVVMSSVSAARGFPLEAIYGVSKAAVQALAQNIAVEYRSRGIRCNCVCPAFVNTPHGNREIRDFKALGVEWSDGAIVDTQLRICEPEEVANVALFLASDEADFVNGTAVVIDNGWMAKA